MRLFLYEFITGGGLLPADARSDDGVERLPPSLLAEGRAMISALATDALAIPGLEFRILWDHRLELPDLPAACLRVVSNSTEAQQAFKEKAAAAEGTIVIAPESDGILFERARAVLSAGGQLLSAPPKLVELCSDKQRTAEHLCAAGVPVPRGLRLSPGDELPAGFPLPAVIKPVDGCGSQDVRMLTEFSHLADSLSMASRLEEFCPGEAVSVAVLCGSVNAAAGSPRILQPLPACRQHLATNGTFAYEGGSLPLPQDLAERAQSLALKAVASLPEPLGYIGVDLVLGPAADGSQDVVIEVNPRLTTSYVGLRRATDDNLLAAWLQIAAGQAPSLKFRSAPIQFRANGQVTQ